MVTIEGGDGDDHIVHSGYKAGSVAGGAGNDHIICESAPDTIYGNDGNDFWQTGWFIHLHIITCFSDYFLSKVIQGIVPRSDRQGAKKSRNLWSLRVFSILSVYYLRLKVREYELTFIHQDLLILETR